MMEAGQARHAVDLLLELRSGGDVSSFSLMLSLLERALEDSDALDLTLQEQLELRISLVGIASHIGDHVRFTRFAPGLLEQLKRASGLVDWHQLSDDLSPPQRLDAACKRAEQRYLARSEAERGLHPLEAIQPLARLCASFGTMAGIANEPELLEDVPSLVPFAPLSPAIGVAELAMEGMKHAVICQVDTAASIFRAAVARISQPDRAGLDELSANATRYGMLYMIGTIEALLGVPTAADHVAELKTVPGHRANAWRTQRLVHMMQGDLQAASEAQRQAELLQLQDGEMTARSPAVTDLTIQMLSEDLIGLKQTIERLEQETQRYPKRRQLLQTARSHYRRLQGDSEGALRELEPAIAAIDYENPRALTSGSQLALGAYLAALTSLNRQDEGLLIAQALVRTWNDTRIYPPGIAKPVIEAFAKGERVQDALELAERSIEYAHSWGAKGLGIGPLYEARARVALAMKDTESFERFAKLCSQEYRLGRSGALNAKYARLMQGAERDGVELSSDLLHELSGEGTDAATLVNSVRGSS
jgi:tetratricopeptide (TPR) repeat protein